MWNRVRQSLSMSQRDYTVMSGTAVAGIRGTTFNVDLSRDQTTNVSVFDGEVWVTNYTDYLRRAREHPQDFKIPDGGFKRPREVPGPRLATREEWIAIVRAQRQVRVSPQGDVGEPEPIPEAAEDDDWIEWNQERDSATPDPTPTKAAPTPEPTPTEPAPAEPTTPAEPATPEPAPAEPAAPEPAPAEPAAPEPASAEPAPPAPEQPAAEEPAESPATEPAEPAAEPTGDPGAGQAPEEPPGEAPQE